MTYQVTQDTNQTAPPPVRYRIGTTEFSKQSGLAPVTLWKRSVEDPCFPTSFFNGGKKLYYQDEVTEWIESTEHSVIPKLNLLGNKV